MDILRSLPKARQSNQFAVVTTNKYTKLKNTIQCQMANFMAVTRDFSELCVVNPGIQSKLFTDSDPQFVSWFLWLTAVR